MKFNFKADSGQIGVIILLTMTGMLVMGLSAASRTTQEALLSGKESESVRVFNAAEQGVEEALSGDLAFVGNSLEGSIDTVSGINIDYSVNKVSSLQTRIFEGISVGVDVTGVQDGDNLRIDWSNVSDCDTENVASLVASIYYDDAGVTRARYSALGGCDKSDGFDLGTVIDENGYRRRYDLPLQTDDFLVQLKSVYSDTYINVSSSDFTMPVQYYSIRSEAENPDSNEARVVEVNRTLQTAPSILDYAVYSGNSLVK